MPDVHAFLRRSRQSRRNLILKNNSRRGAEEFFVRCSSSRLQAESSLRPSHRLKAGKLVIVILLVIVIGLSFLGLRIRLRLWSFEEEGCPPPTGGIFSPPKAPPEGGTPNSGDPWPRGGLLESLRRSTDYMAGKDWATDSRRSAQI